MIFFGTRGKTITGKPITGMECPSCGNNQYMSFGVLRYFHLYWIPTFLTKKIVGVECTHCKKALIDKELPADFAKKIKASVFSATNTTPMFAGLIIITCLVLFGVYTAQQDNQREAAYIAQPMVNDLYIVNFTKIFDNTDPKYKYGVIRVKSLANGQAELQVSTIAYNKSSGPRKDIRERKTSSDTYYDDKPIYIELDKLKEMKQSGAIYSIERS